MKKFSLKIYMKICERMHPILAQIRKMREEYELALYDFIHSEKGTTFHGMAITTASNAHKMLRELNKQATQTLPEKILKKYQKTLDKYIFICYNKDTKSKEI